MISDAIRSISTESNCQTDNGRRLFSFGVGKKCEIASCGLSSRLWRNAKRLRSSLVLDDRQPGAVLFFHLFRRNYSAAKVCELH
jgi:hypothetical protein